MPAALAERLSDEARATFAEAPRDARFKLLGQALGVTAPQAKALLHRARQSFRQAWESASAGVAGFLPILFGPIKRLFGQQAADATHDVEFAARVQSPASPVELSVCVAAEAWSGLR